MIEFEKFMLCQEAGGETGGNGGTSQNPDTGVSDDSHTGGNNNGGNNTNPEQGEPIEPQPNWGFGGFSLKKDDGKN